MPPQGLEPYERERTAVVIRLVIGAVFGAGVGWRIASSLSVPGGVELLATLAGAGIIGYVSVAYGDQFWSEWLRFRSGWWRR